MKRIISTLLVLCSFCLSVAPSLGQEPWRELDRQLYPTDVTYDSRIPTPEEYLGRPLGAAPVRHHELVDYINTVAAMSDRLTVEIAGYSHERPPILFVVATSPARPSRAEIC